MKRKNKAFSGKLIDKNKKKNVKNRFDKSGKLCSVLVKNLPFSIKKKDVKAHFKKFGDIFNVKLMTRERGRLTGNGFIHFNDANAAEAAIKETSGKDFMGRKIEVEWAKTVLKRGHNISVEENNVNFRSPVKKEIDDNKSNIMESDENSEEAEEKTHESKDEGDYYNDKKAKKKSYAQGESHRTELPAKMKRGRIIIRNLPFKTTEETLLNHFSEFGTILEIKLLKRDDGKLVGCGFVQFQKKQSAIRAILARSGKEFLGRPIVCDWALPKDKYMKQMKPITETKSENVTFDGRKIKEEPCSEESDIETKVISEVDNNGLDSEEDGEGSEDSDNETKIKLDVDNDEELDSEEDDGGGSEDYSDEDNENQSTWRNESSKEDYQGETKRTRVISNDVTEGCTIFVKNIPFSATNNDLEICMKQFGPVYYALICIDKLTEHSKGTGFVKFKNKDDAEKCLQSSELIIKDQTIEVLNALPRNEIESLHDRKKEKKVKDNRHLYLVKEGVILAGSPAAKDVSVTDMEKRLKTEQWKTQMLRNLNMFVSNTRLIIYNVPSSWTDTQVRHLFKEHGGPRAIIKEARIMRDLRNVDVNGVGKSKEFAFVHFTEHEHALRALRSINNNPNIFSKSKRPIVTFSIENKAIHKIKQKRLQKSQKTNAEKQNSGVGAHSGSSNVHPQHKNRGYHLKNSHRIAETQKFHKTEEDPNPFSGLEGKPGNKKMRNKFKIKTQADIHMRNVKKDKQKLKKMKIQNRNKKFREPQIKKKKVEKDSFSRLVDQYKSKLMTADSQTKRTRWYE